MAKLTVEIVTAGEYSVRLLRRTLEMWSGMAVLAIVSCTIVGPTVLGLLGHQYSAHGGTLLRVVGLSAPFTGVTACYQAFTWLDRRVWLLLINSICKAIAPATATVTPLTIRADALLFN